ncbi:protein FAR1-RELATED SEQUENCE [Salix suchowensis]|nr:protein FAR1-RELATED SEQUENCE [Salix suchowensis]
MEERLEGLSVTKPKGLKAGASLSSSLSWLLFVAFAIINVPPLLLLETLILSVLVLMLLVDIEAGGGGGRGESRAQVAIVVSALIDLVVRCLVSLQVERGVSLDFQMEEVCLNTESVGNDDADECEIEGDCAMTEYVSETGVIENPLPPSVGMEFESYEDVYYFYNCYAKQQGFGIRVSNTWYRKSKERYRGKLSCSSAGFKKKSEANRPRPETRTGCPAMVKFRLMENKRWKIIEVELEHNHLITQEVVNSINLIKLLAPGRKEHCNWMVLKKIPETLGELFDLEAIKVSLSKVVYYFLRPEEFEAAWDEMTQNHGIRDHKWIQTLYEDRKRWVPAYLKETFLAGMVPLQQNETTASFFEGYLDRHTSLKEFMDNYDQALQANHQLESLADMDSRNSSCMLKSRCYFELQLSKLYTNEIARRFEREVEGMYSCFCTRQAYVDGQVMTYLVKEQVEVEGSKPETRDFEVMYNASEMDVLCVCGLFNFCGYLCRHALSVLNQHGLEEIPPQYILGRWRKDTRRSYVLDHGCRGIDTNNPIHRYDHLYKCIVRVVEEGRKSQDCSKATQQALADILNKLHLVEDWPCNM